MNSHVHIKWLHGFLTSDDTVVYFNVALLGDYIILIVKDRLLERQDSMTSSNFRVWFEENAPLSVAKTLESLVVIGRPSMFAMS